MSHEELLRSLFGSDTNRWLFQEKVKTLPFTQPELRRWAERLLNALDPFDLSNEEPASSSSKDYSQTTVSESPRRPEQWRTLCKI